MLVDCTVGYRQTFVSVQRSRLGRDPRATGYAESDMACFSSEGCAEHRHLVLHLRVGEREDSGWTVILVSGLDVDRKLHFYYL